jgi:hypothetical protein
MHIQTTRPRSDASIDAEPTPQSDTSRTARERPASADAPVTFSPFSESRLPNAFDDENQSMPGSRD